MRPWALLLLGAACAEAPAARTVAEPLPPVELRAAVDRASVSPGDTLVYTVQAQHNPDIEVKLDPPAGALGGLTVQESGQEPLREAEGRVRDTRWWRLVSDRPGSFVIPAMHGLYRVAATDQPWASVSSGEVFVEVGVTPQGLKDIKPLQQVHFHARWPWVVAAVLWAAAAVALAVWAWRRRKPRRIGPPLPAHVVALSRLGDLRQAQLADDAAVRRWYFALSEVLRTYVEARFQLNATDLTTEEIFARLPHLVELQGDERARLRDFLQDTDRVKFAGTRATREDCEAAHQRALRFVQATAVAAPGEV